MSNEKVEGQNQREGTGGHGGMILGCISVGDFVYMGEFGVNVWVNVHLFRSDAGHCGGDVGDKLRGRRRSEDVKMWVM